MKKKFLLQAHIYKLSSALYTPQCLSIMSTEEDIGGQETPNIQDIINTTVDLFFPPETTTSTMAPVQAVTTTTMQDNTSTTASDLLGPVYVDTSSHQETYFPTGGTPSIWPASYTLEGGAQVTFHQQYDASHYFPAVQQQPANWWSAPHTVTSGEYSQLQDYSGSQQYACVPPAAVQPQTFPPTVLPAWQAEQQLQSQPTSGPPQVSTDQSTLVTPVVSASTEHNTDETISTVQVISKPLPSLSCPVVSLYGNTTLSLVSQSEPVTCTTSSSAVTPMAPTCDSHAATLTSKTVFLGGKKRIYGVTEINTRKIPARAVKRRNVQWERRSVEEARNMQEEDIDLSSAPRIKTGPNAYMMSRRFQQEKNIKHLYGLNFRMFHMDCRESALELLRRTYFKDKELTQEILDEVMATTWASVAGSHHDFTYMMTCSKNGDPATRIPLSLEFLNDVTLSLQRRLSDAKKLLQQELSDIRHCCRTRSGLLSRLEYIDLCVQKAIKTYNPSYRKRHYCPVAKELDNDRMIMELRANHTFYYTAIKTSLETIKILYSSIFDFILREKDPYVAFKDFNEFFKKLPGSEFLRISESPNVEIVMVSVCGPQRPKTYHNLLNLKNML